MAGWAPDGFRARPRLGVDGPIRGPSGALPGPFWAVLDQVLMAPPNLGALGEKMWLRTMNLSLTCKYPAAAVPYRSDRDLQQQGEHRRQSVQVHVRGCDAHPAWLAKRYLDFAGAKNTKTTLRVIGTAQLDV